MEKELEAALSPKFSAQKQGIVHVFLKSII